MAVRDPLEPDPARDRLNDRLTRAEAILEHRFADRSLLAEALTHRSAAGRQGERGTPSNERLEFVGDRVLGLMVAEWLLERFPLEPEGALGRRHAQLVSREVLAVIAERAGLSEALSIGASETRAGVGQLATVLADAMEALIGALWLDGGVAASRTLVRRAWAEAMDAMVAPPKDPKTELQEWLMARGLPLPVYRVTERSGPAHAPEFVMAVSGGGMEGTGRAPNKRLAERGAAAALLARLQSGG